MQGEGNKLTPMHLHESDELKNILVGLAVEVLGTLQNNVQYRCLILDLLIQV